VGFEAARLPSFPRNNSGHPHPPANTKGCQTYVNIPPNHFINQTMKKRCQWAKDEPNTTYHDEEWGTPQHDDQKLFEFLILEGAQAGLSWVTILNRRDGYRKAFSDFDAKKVSK